MPCYASSLGDCEGGITGEHYISEVVMLALGESIEVRGFAWLGGNTRRLPTGTLVANNLCAHHNHALSSLDAEAGRLMRRLVAYHHRSEDADTEIDGDRIERWMVKVLCGLLSSGAAERQGTAVQGWVPPRSWLEILYGRRAMDDGCGLRFFHVPGRAGRQLAVTPTSNHIGEPYGLTVELMGFTFHVSLVALGVGQQAGGDVVEHHPIGIAFGEHAERGAIRFVWPHGAPTGQCVIIKPATT